MDPSHIDAAVTVPAKKTQSLSTRPKCTWKVSTKILELHNEKKKKKLPKSFLV